MARLPMLAPLLLTLPLLLGGCDQINSLLGKKEKGEIFSAEDYISAAVAFGEGYSSAETEGKIGEQLLWPALVDGGAVLLGAATSEAVEKKLTKIPNEAAKTVMITKADISQIKKETGRIQLPEENEKSFFDDDYEEDFDDEVVIEDEE